MNRGRRGVHLGVAALAMCDAIPRIFRLLFGSPQPIEWWLLGADLAIVALIIWLDVPERLHKLKVQRCVADLGEFMDKGQKLMSTVPRPVSGGAGPSSRSTSNLPSYSGNVSAWRTAVEEWITETNHFLTSKSPRAAAAFMLISVTGVVANPQIVYTESGESFPISEDTLRESYQRLVVRLDNLRSIMEKPEAYF